MDEYQLECMLEHIHYMSNTLGIAESTIRLIQPSVRSIAPKMTSKRPDWHTSCTSSYMNKSQKN